MEGFQDLQWFDFMRIATAILAVVGMYRLGLMFIIRKRAEKNDRRAPERRLDDFFWVVSATMFAFMLGSFENVAGDSPYRSASLLTFMITLVTIRATRGRKSPITHL